jgi:hypothetical protein
MEHGARGRKSEVGSQRKRTVLLGTRDYALGTMIISNFEIGI